MRNTIFQNKIVRPFKVGFFLSHFLLFEMNVIFILYFVFGLLLTVSCEVSLTDVYSPTLSFKLDLDDELSSKNPFDITIQEVEVLPENCTRALEIFTESITNFTRCALHNARPIRVCMNCEKEIKNTQESYNKLRSESDICQKFYFESDQIRVVDLVYAQGQTIWTINNCQNCYDHACDTERFFNISQNLDACVKRFNHSSVMDANNTCDACHEIFTELNELYKRFVNNIQTEDLRVCMDIVDEMNITRHFWISQKCLNFNYDIGYPNIVTAVLVGAMPVFFYMLSKNISIIEDVKLVRPKRKSFTYSNSM